jgi:hypothetical protein
MKYGSKDLMRIMDIRKRAENDLLEEMQLAYQMAQEIEIPGKAIARGYASLEVYGTKYSPVAAIFFDRACKLTGEDDIDDIQAMASMNSVKGGDEEVEAAYDHVPTEKQPASRWPVEKRAKNTIGKKSVTNIVSMGKVNVVKGEGPEFNVYYSKTGTVEVWKTEADKTKLIYTASPDPNYKIGEEHEFRCGSEWEKWKMIDYIDANAMVNLMPLYGTTLPIYGYN